MPDVKPLSAGEIAELRKSATEPFYDSFAETPHSRLVLRLLDEVERTRALLRRIEWQGGEARYGFCCPDCGVEKNDERPAHAANCELAGLLGGEG
jgi:hypothetical protein